MENYCIFIRNLSLLIEYFDNIFKKEIDDSEKTLLYL